MHPSVSHCNDRSAAGKIVSILLLLILSGNIVLVNLPINPFGQLGLEWMEMAEMEHEGKEHADPSEIDKFDTPAPLYLNLYLSTIGWGTSLKHSTTFQPVGYLEIFSPPPEGPSLSA